MNVKASVKFNKKVYNKKIIASSINKPKDEILHTMLQDEVLFVFNEQENTQKRSNFVIQRLV